MRHLEWILRITYVVYLLLYVIILSHVIILILTIEYTRTVQYSSTSYPRNLIVIITEFIGYTLDLNSLLIHRHIVGRVYLLAYT